MCWQGHSASNGSKGDSFLAWSSFWGPQTFVSQRQQNSKFCLCILMAFSVCLALNQLSTTSSVCDLEHGAKCNHLGLIRGPNIIKYIYFALWHMTGTQLVSNKYFFDTVILFSKAFPMVRLSIHPQNKLVSTSNHCKREWRF